MNFPPLEKAIKDLNPTDAFYYQLNILSLGRLKARRR